MVVEAAAAPATWWDNSGAISGCVGAWQAKGAASYAASLLDLSGNANNLTENLSTVDWSTDNGWEFDGGDTFDTGITPVNNQTWSMIVQYAGYTPGNYHALCGTLNNPPSFLIQPGRGGTTVSYWHGSRFDKAPALAAGNLAIAGDTAYRDGSAESGTIPSAAGTHTYSIYVGAYNDKDPTNCITANVYALAIYNATLTEAEVAAVAAAMAAL
jgi:hypothetical protein